MATLFRRGHRISQDPLGFDAGDSNLYRYVSNNPSTNLDPSGKVDRTIEFHYDKGMQLKIKQEVENEVDRIFQDIVTRFASKGNNLTVHFIGHPNAASLKGVQTGWTKAQSGATSLPRWWEWIVLGPYVGFLVTGGRDPRPIFEKGNTVRIRIDEVPGKKGLSIGQGTGFGLTLFPVNFKAAMDLDPLVAKDPPMALAATIAHEAGLHCIGGKVGHFSGKGFVDSDIAAIGGKFSAPAAKLFLNGLGIPLK